VSPDGQDGNGKLMRPFKRSNTNIVNRLFLLEGLITFLIGVASWVLLPASISQTAGRGRGKGWFTEHEEKILVNRLLRDDPSKGDMHNRQAVNLPRLWKCLKDYDLWPLYMVSNSSLHIPEMKLIFSSSA
jgi:hypothetical protein